MLVVGMGERDSLDAMTVFRATAAAARHLAGKERCSIVFYIGDAIAAELAEHIVAAAIVGCTGQDLYRSERKRLCLARCCFRA